MTIEALAWTEEKSAHLGTSSFTAETGEGKLRIGHHRAGDDLVKIRFTLAMEPEFADYHAWKAARDAAGHGTPEHDRLDAMMLGNSEIGYFNTAQDAMRLLEVARAGTDKSVDELLAEAGFAREPHELDYPEQGRHIVLYRKRAKSGFFTVYVENGQNVHLTYEGRNALGHRNLMNVAFAEAHGDRKFTVLFWPSFVTTQTAALMAATFAGEYAAQGRTGRLKRR